MIRIFLDFWGKISMTNPVREIRIPNNIPATISECGISGNPIGRSAKAMVIPMPTRRNAI
ncbi:hypothetical protein DIM_11870 [Candidatus Denitrolinea symbiosum]|nr:hypothetical protein DIM_11870 [Candidatus Denitrolinea symbiosum]